MQTSLRYLGLLMMLSYWATGGVSVIGPLHIRENIPNQDYWLGKEYSWGSVLVVSDGLGSKPYADVGSKAACESVVEIAEKWDFDRDFDQERFTRRIHSEWLRRILPLRAEDCSATCLFAIQVGERCFLGKLGDGMICLGSWSDEAYVEVNHDNSDGFSNLTLALYSQYSFADWEVSVHDLSLNNFVFICTDGIADDLLKESVKEFACGVAKASEQKILDGVALEVPDWLVNWPVKGHTDDKTFALMVRKVLKK
ncbi:PP2C family serine/threonine-protein phosphatase [Vibrio sp. VB16]|uniref:PP2C family serine/threonine-protein phosphatase n=1 Tax=Vibrio sp. VB16 TaxID=2785746 RepID=UPI00189DF014|nr:PP2C family serine/threonine-protein phosphatase [Vibrio sp. VB16]UGA53698.1 protein phosphatase 2C domain-containing protein [Vibrio sp. VB16]